MIKMMFRSAVLMVILHMWTGCHASNILVAFPVLDQYTSDVMIEMARNLAAEGHTLTILPPMKFKKSGSDKDIKVIEIPKFKPEVKRSWFYMTEQQIEEAKMDDISAARRRVTDLIHGPDFKNWQKKQLEFIDIVIVSTDHVETIAALSVIIRKAEVITMGLDGYDYQKMSTLSNNWMVPDDYSVNLGTGAKESQLEWFHILWNSLPGPRMPCSLTLICDHHLISGPGPLLSNQVEVPSLQIVYHKRLSLQEETFMNRSEKGVVFVDLGDRVTNDEMPTFLRDLLQDGIDRTNMTMAWLTNYKATAEMTGLTRLYVFGREKRYSILKHKSTSVHVSSCDQGSIQAALTHRVPLLCLPISRQQKYAARVQHNTGRSISLQWDAIDEDEITRSLMNLTSAEVKAKIHETSQALKLSSSTAPMQRAIWYIDYIIRFKDHDVLTYVGEQMNPAIIISVDIMLIFIVLLIIVSIFTIIFYINLKKRVKYYKQVLAAMVIILYLLREQCVYVVLWPVENLIEYFSS